MSIYLSKTGKEEGLLSSRDARHPEIHKRKRDNMAIWEGE